MNNSIISILPIVESVYSFACVVYSVWLLQ